MSTERLDENKGTVRVEESGSTQRLDNTGSTQRLDQGDSTQRLDGGSTQGAAVKQAAQIMPEISTAAANKAGEVFSVGNVVELGGNNYIIDSVISMSSGEAVIYQISRQDKPYVLKFYKPGFSMPSNVLTVIRDNPRENIIKLYEFGTYVGQNYEIMELAQGGTLSDYIKKDGAIKDINLLKNIIGQISEGLHQLHKDLRIIYQDLKPENIYFKDKDRKNIVIADFGISSVMRSGEDLAEVNANATMEYAAPDLARILNQKEVIVGPPVDYFALGVTMMQLWQGTAKPFQGMTDAERSHKINNKSVEFPSDMDENYKILIQGLIDPAAKTRWGYDHIKKWIAGENLKIDYAMSIAYIKKAFNESEYYSSPAELADLMEKYKDRGVQYLYNGIVSKWLDDSKDEYTKILIDEVIKTYSDEKQKSMGLTAAIYTLNPSKPFTTNGGKVCANDAELADALLEESAFYMEDLKKADSSLYVNLAVTGGENGKIFAEKFQKIFNEYSPKRALNLLYLKLQEDGGQSITIGEKTYYSPDEVGKETDDDQIDLIIEALDEKDSLFLVWLSDHFGDFFDTTEGFADLPVQYSFFLFGKFPFLVYKELDGWEEMAISDLCELLFKAPGRLDLLEVYAKQGLPFVGQAEDFEDKYTCLNVFAYVFDQIPDSKKAIDILKFLVKNGADINAFSGNGSLPLTTAILNGNVPLVKALLEAGADPNKGEDFNPIFWVFLDRDKPITEKVKIDMITLLLDYKADSNVVYGGFSPLWYVLYFKTKEKIDLMKRLISAGANVNFKSEDGDTVLYQSVLIYANKDNVDSRDTLFTQIELLLQNGANPNTLRKNGYWSPLMACADENLGDLAKLLMKYKAKKGFADIDGDTAYVYAKKKKHQDVSWLLDPKSELVGKVRLINSGSLLIKVLSYVSVFLTMDVLARIVQFFNVNSSIMIYVSIGISHILVAYMLIMHYGIRDYLAKLKGTFSFVASAVLFLVGVPVIFPLVVAGLQFGTRFLPDSITGMLSIPAELLTSSNNGIVILISYLAVILVFVAIKIVYEKLTDKSMKAWRMYKMYV
jgi:serine/threonine protein kinase/ankyrin repeat protein